MFVTRHIVAQDVAQRQGVVRITKTLHHLHRPASHAFFTLASSTSHSLRSATSSMGAEQDGRFCWLESWAMNVQEQRLSCWRQLKWLWLLVPWKRISKLKRRRKKFNRLRSTLDEDEEVADRVFPRLPRLLELCRFVAHPRL